MGSRRGAPARMATGSHADLTQRAAVSRADLDQLESGSHAGPARMATASHAAPAPPGTGNNVGLSRIAMASHADPGQLKTGSLAVPGRLGSRLSLLLQDAGCRAALIRMKG